MMTFTESFTVAKKWKQLTCLIGSPSLRKVVGSASAQDVETAKECPSHSNHNFLESIRDLNFQGKQMNKIVKSEKTHPGSWDT